MNVRRKVNKQIGECQPLFYVDIRWEIRNYGPLLTVATTFFIAELGDKTMLLTITIASEQKSFIAVWLASTVGMVIADGIAIIVGIVMGKNLPERLVEYGAAAVFVISGVYTFYEAFAAS